MNKSPRNKTISVSIDEARHLLDECVYENELSSNTIINKLIIGDTFNILPTIDKNLVDCIIVDPPYNLTKNFNGRIFKKKKDADYIEYTTKWLTHMLRILKDDGTLYVCCDWQTSLLIAPILLDKTVIHNRITWQREKGRGSNKNFKNCHEDIWVCSKKGNIKFYSEQIKQRRLVIAPYKNKDGTPKDWVEGEKNYRDTYCSNFWDDITIPFWSMPENTPHPTQKPEKLIAKLICASTKQGDLILDPFSGSGTSIVVAKKLNRNFIGIEMDEQYATWSMIRLKEANKNNRIQGYEKGVFHSRNYSK